MTVTVTSALAGPATARYSNVYGALVDLGVLSGLGAQDVTGSGDPVAPILNAAGFYAPLTNSLVLTRGTGDPTYSRATNAWEFDNEGKLITVPSGSARFGGARFVQNCVNQSQAFTSWTLIENTISATTGPGGVSGAVKLVPSAVDGYHEAYIGAAAPVNSEIRTWSIYAKASGYNYLMINAYANFSRRVWFNLANGTVGYTTSGTTASITDVGDGWYRCFVKVTGAYTGTTTFELVAINANGIGNNRPSFAGDATSGVTIWGAQIENVTGQADQTASEYVSVGALSAPYHGAGVDGVKWFSTNKDGSAISASTLLGNHAEGARTNSLLCSRLVAASNTTWKSPGIGSAAFTDDFSSSTGWTLSSGWSISGGALISDGTTSGAYASKINGLTANKTYEVSFEITEETTTGGGVSVVLGAQTQQVSTIYTGVGVKTAILQSLNNTVISITCRGAGTWAGKIDNISVKEAAIQVTTCTGIDNAANSASTLTAGAADATILQTLTMAAAARSFSAYVKRRTGTGNVYITRDGGTNWTDITASVGASWTRVKIENTSVLNPVCGFKIATSGDAIDVDVCQDEAGAEAWSPIVTTTAAVTRNADAETFQTASNWSDTAGWALATVQGESWANATGTAIGNGTNGLKLSASNSGIVAYDGTNTVNGPAGSPSGAEKLAMTWGSGALQAASGGVAGSAGSYDGAWGLATVGIGTSQGNVYIKDVYIGQSALTAAQLAQVTA